MPRPEGNFVNYEPDEKSLGDALAPGQLVIRQAVVADIPRIVETNEQSGQDSVGLLPLAAAISDESRLVVVASVEGPLLAGLKPISGRRRTSWLRLGTIWAESA